MSFEIIKIIFGIVSVFLALGAFKSVSGAGKRLGMQRLMAALFWSTFGAACLLLSFPLGLALAPLGWVMLAGSAASGFGWALTASANKDRMLPRG